MTNVIFSFDTEDYVNPHAADGILRVSRIVREAGFTPCHNLVARTAEALEKWGRQDVLDELKKCEIETHSLAHSHHPTINEYTDIADFDEAMRRFRANEDKALEIIRGILGDCAFSAACPPGSSVSYVAHYGYADMGIPVYDGDILYDEVHGRPVSFCNMLCLEYHCCMDVFGDWDKAQVLDMIEKMARYDVVVCYHHPAKNAAEEFCDRLNFEGANRDAREWIMSTPRSTEWIAKFEENMRFLAETVKNDPRFIPSTYTEIAKKYTTHRVVKPRDIPKIRRAIGEDLFPVTLPESLSLADMMLACRDFLQGKPEHVCGKVYGFLDVPYAVSQPVRIRPEELRRSAVQIEDGKFLPTVIDVGGKKLGPADWLRAALAILDGAEEFTVVPDRWQIDLNEFPRLRSLRLKGSWVHSPDFEDAYISDRLRLQSWTIRLPKGTMRKIF